ncbi:MAG TPA: type II toxin-antitoxin system RelE/ParE family toxin [Flammeovirgaceae bacterium]|nr:type II toxin-antitoxin system RelE/ParE family toxin [Flammeovirgaceae bacterium]
MKSKFEIVFLENVIDFFESIEDKARDKIIFNIHLVRKSNDPKLFKKLEDEIWEFRTLYNKKQYRLFAFWDKTTETKTLVVATHGIIKKTQKIPTKEILKAKELKKRYFEKR